jgi:hypothetical protein
VEFGEALVHATRILNVVAGKLPSDQKLTDPQYNPRI